MTNCSSLNENYYGWQSNIEYLLNIKLYIKLNILPNIKHLYKNN